MSDDQDDGDKGDKSKSGGGGGSGGRTRGGRNPTMGSDEWARQRKDNHVRYLCVFLFAGCADAPHFQKEVERRRRGNINEGINELGRIVPNSSGEKAKGAILARAVQYIHHLKENEARNIEKWTLEKLLMDQAMGDLQAQLEEMRRLWNEEQMARQRAESELELLRGVSQAPGMAQPRSAPHGLAGSNVAAASSDQPRTRSPERQEERARARESKEGENHETDPAEGRPGKRPRAD